MEHFLTKYVRMYAQKMDEGILETRCLDEWAVVFNVDQFATSFEASTADRLRTFLKYSFRTNVRRPPAPARRTSAPGWLG